jgi:hypothetical protein
MTGRALARVPWPAAVVLAAAVAALLVHLPGHLSVDSVIALYEAQTGEAFSWTPTFQSALLAWVGGGLRSSALHVVAMALLTAAAFVALLPPTEANPLRRGAALMVALNPLAWMMVGVVWRDVLLGTAMLVAAAALLRLRCADGRARASTIVLHAVVVIALAVAALARPQGLVLAAAGGVAYAALVMRGPHLAGAVSSIATKLALLMATPLLVAVLVLATHATIRPLPPATPTMDGVGLVMAYDIAGTLAGSERLRSVSVPKLDDTLRTSMLAAYDSRRIDPLQATPGFREWIIRERARGLWPAWRTVVAGDPLAYLEHRAAAAGALLGVDDVRECLPGYWGVAGLPPMLAALGIEEAMDDRDRWLGRQAAWLAGTPWFWNASYLVLLLVLAPSILRSSKADPVPMLLALGALTFAAAYLLTTVACDVRYLYPVATVATALALDRLRGPARKAGSDVIADLR